MAEIEIVDSGDVYVHPIGEEVCERCEESENGILSPAAAATQIVTLDIRQLGREITIGLYCDKCAEEVASELRSALPLEV